MHADETHEEPVLSRVIAAVDSDPFLLRALGRALTTAGYRIMLFDNPWTALTGLSATSVDAVILDRDLPGCSGPSLARRLNERWGGGSPPMILLSGDRRGLAPRDEKLFAHVANKPVRADDLVGVLRRTRRSSGIDFVPPHA